MPEILPPEIISPSVNTPFVWIEAHNHNAFDVKPKASVLIRKENPGIWVA